jgi:hypothetical protein
MANEDDRQKIVTGAPSAEGIARAASAVGKGRGPAPVHLWNPPFCGDLDIRIARDGTWFYLGTPIGRAPLVKLFSNILKLEEGKYYLVTPVEKVGIRVDDAPLHVIDFAVQGAGRDQVIRLQCRTEEEVTLDEDHALRVPRDPVTDEPSPYVHIRGGLEARIDRKTFYRLVDLGTQESRDGASWFGLWSAGQFFSIIPAAHLS